MTLHLFFAWAIAGAPSALAEPLEGEGPPPAVADVLAVAVSGAEGAWSFAVTLRSPDVGCERYADWWEVVSEDGALLYRRVLRHSHVDEQPFTRSGGAVPAGADQVVIVRAHMSPGGYGGAALRGTPGGGFEPVTLEDGWAMALSEAAPLPDRCAY